MAKSLEMVFQHPTNEEILARLEQGESGVLERKSSLPNQQEIRKTLVAFANSLQQGEWAVLVIGIDDKGNVIGVEGSDSAQQKISQVAQQECYPPVECHPRLLNYHHKVVLVVVIPASSLLPHFAGQAFVRRGSRCEQASAQMFKELIAKHHDKARRLIEAKGKDVSLELYPDDRTKIPPGQDHVSRRRYAIVTCEAQEVTIVELGRGKRIRLPLCLVHVCASDHAGIALHLRVSDQNLETFYL